MRLPGLHSIHWKVFVFHLAVLILPLGYISWKVRTSIETSYLHSTEEGMIDTAAVVSEFYARLYGQFGADSGKVAEELSRVYSNLNETYEIKARLFGFTKAEVDTRLLVYDLGGRVIFDTKGAAANQDFSKWTDVGHALKGEYGSRWELDKPHQRVNIYSTLPVFVNGKIVGAVSVSKSTNRIRNFHLAMTTDFSEFDFPAGTGSPTERARTANGWNFTWSYPDVINAQPIAMAMPSVANPGPVASRISFFAPVSLLFFFAVLVLMGMVWGISLHPMNYFFLAAGCFAFQLLFAYLVDLIPLPVAFVISAVVSLAPLCGYLFAAVGRRFAQLAAAAQFAYMILFSYSFFFEGLTGLTIAIGAIVTLALLMATTAKMNWADKFASKATVRAFPPPVPGT